MNGLTFQHNRPEMLYPLYAGLETLEGVGPKLAKALSGLGVELPRDLLFVLPHGGVDRSRTASVRDVPLPGVATVEAEVIAHYPPAKKGRPYRVTVRDGAMEFQLVYFHARGDYLAKLLPKGGRRLLSGKVELFDQIAQMVHPDYVLLPEEADQLADYEPLYPLTAGLTQKTLARIVRAALARAPALPEWIDPHLKQREGWPDWHHALHVLHHPQNALDMAPHALARLRLAYDELFAHQLTLALARAGLRRLAGVSSRATGQLQQQVLDALPYRPTRAQQRAVHDILADLAAPVRMNRLLQGDVGSGKTLVAFLALLGVIEAGGQGVFMAPTDILARQHYETLVPMAKAAGIDMLLLTGRDKGKERARKLAALAGGEVHLLLGTHAVFQGDVVFHDLRLAVIDEQHRFGVEQRMALGSKGRAVDVLVMTATPIPRSLALAGYGDMDISVLDEKPPGRKPVKTAVISNDRMDEVVAHLRGALDRGQQAYWVCPLVEESEVLDYASTEARFRHLCAALGAHRVGLVHGQMPVAEKDAAMARFVQGDLALLVATTVIEVGVNVPNASIMVIERADVFGLAQLHQLRGRVGRGEAQSTCLLIYQPPMTKTAEQRLQIMRETEDGFLIAEEDLRLRGAGDLIGTAQSGLPRFRVADLEHHGGLMALAQSDARKLLLDDPRLETTRGQAARMLLWLLNHEKAVRLIGVG